MLISPLLIRRKSTIELDFEINQENLKSSSSQVKDNLFLHGIIYSSDFLFDAIIKYLSNEKTRKKKFKQTRRGVMKFYNRAKYDSTPLSTFTEIKLFELGIKKNLKSKRTKIFVEPNLFLFQFILDFFREYPEHFCGMKYCINKTTLAHNNELRFISSIKNEIGITLTSEEILVHTYEFFKSKSAINFKDLKIWFQEEFQAPEHKAVNLLKLLISNGFFILSDRPNLLTENNKCEAFINFLKEQLVDEGTNHISELIDILNNLDELIKKYSLEIDINDVNEKLKVIMTLFNHYFLKLEKCLKIEAINFPFKNYNLIYIDLVDESTEGIEIKDFDLKINAVQDFIENFYIPSEWGELQRLIDQFYKKNYGDNNKVQFIDFYLKFFAYFEREAHFIDLFKNEKSEKIEVFEHEMKNSLKKFIEQEKMSFEKKYINLEGILLKKYCNDKRKHSHSLYFNLIGDDLISINTISDGYGRAESRFIKYYEKKYQNVFHNLTNNHHQNETVFELSDYNFFNANLHTNLASSEIDYHLNHYYSEDTYKINLNEIFVTCRNNEIILINTDGKKLYPININLQNEGQRSQLFRFLVSFNSAPKLYLNLLYKLIDEIFIEIQTDKSIQYVPGVKITDKVIYSFEHWIVKKRYSELVIKTSIMNDRHHQLILFLKLNKVPLICFIQFDDGDKYTKPEFFDLNSIIYFEIFEKKVNDLFFIIHPMDCANNESYISTWYA